MSGMNSNLQIRLTAARRIICPICGEPIVSEIAFVRNNMLLCSICGRDALHAHVTTADAISRDARFRKHFTFARGLTLFTPQPATAVEIRTALDHALNDIDLHPRTMTPPHLAHLDDAAHKLARDILSPSSKAPARDE